MRCAGLCLLGLVACALAQQDNSANQYPIEGNPAAPLKTDLVFKTGDPDQEAKSLLPEANIVIGIMSAPNNFDQREAVRATWAQLQSLSDPHLNDLTLEEKQKMVIRFIIGTPKDSATERLVAKEFNTYHDIVRVPVEESYFKLTVKTLEFIKWAEATYRYRWIFKCDDDSFVRVDKLLKELESRGDERLYLGKMWTGTPVDRRVDSFTPFATYNTFAAGAGYALSHDLGAFIARNSKLLHLWPMEDVAVGMWVSGLRVTYVDHPNFHSFPEGCDKDMIVQNPAGSSIMRQVFYHTVNGVPCHMQPDPFNPSNKNITDHVLLEFGIAKPGEGERVTKRVLDPVMLGAQSLITLPDQQQQQQQQQAMVDIPEDSHDAEDEEVDNSMGGEGGLGADVMNGNMPSGVAIGKMNASGLGSGKLVKGEVEDTAAEKMMNIAAF